MVQACIKFGRMYACLQPTSSNFEVNIDEIGYIDVFWPKGESYWKSFFSPTSQRTRYFENFLYE